MRRPREEGIAPLSELLDRSLFIIIAMRCKLVIRIKNESINKNNSKINQVTINIRNLLWILIKTGILQNGKG